MWSVRTRARRLVSRDTEEPLEVARGPRPYVPRACLCSVCRVRVVVRSRARKALTVCAPRARGMKKRRWTRH